jgi:hypothetical protein
MTTWVAVSLCAVSTALADPVVEPGYDLFETESPGTTLLGIELESVSLGLYDFGGGPQPVGNSDTIIEREQKAEPGKDAVPGGSSKFTTPPEPDVGLIAIELVALQLRSVDPVDLGAGLDFYYITLQESTPSLGEMAITFDDPDGGTFDSSFAVFYDLRIGALDGPIVSSSSFDMTSSDNPWDRTPPPGAPQIPGVNTLLNGLDQAADFWPIGVVEHDSPGTAHQKVRSTPEPTSLLLLSLGGLVLLRRRR